MDLLAGLSLLSGTSQYRTALGNGQQNERGAIAVDNDTQAKEKQVGRERKYDGFGEEECQTCANRRYQDGSDDSGVSFQTPTKIDKDAAASAVRSHEMEHVTRNQAKAKRENREVVSQTVTMHTAICPECGDSYVSGGTTHTVTRGQKNYDFSAGINPDPRGNLLDATA